GDVFTEEPRCDDALTVAELEQRLHGLAVARRRRHLGDPDHVDRALRREERQPIACRARERREQRVTFPESSGRGVLQLAHPLEPAVTRQDDGGFLVHDVRFGIVLELLAGREGRPPLVAVALAELEQLGANELPAPLRAAQQRLDLLEALLLL